MNKDQSPAERERQLLQDATRRGLGAKLAVYVRLSGPGWLQSAITLGGGSLAGALFLGVLGGTQLLWLQLVAIAMGVVMLSAISYVVLSTGRRPFREINRHINPVLGWGWLIATCMANMIWCMPQFSLCFAAAQKNLLPRHIEDTLPVKLQVSAVFLVAAFLVLLLHQRQGVTSKIFDGLLKALVGMIVVCFVGVVVLLSLKGQIDWANVFAGFVPNLKQWSQPTGTIEQLLADLPPPLREFWSEKITTEQRAVMIGAAATAVGINMTFLLPYSMLDRGWDAPFRGLARFDLSTGMAIPYLLVTSCVVIASAFSFHAKIDSQFASTDPAVVEQSPLYSQTKSILVQRLKEELGAERVDELQDPQVLALIAALPTSEKEIASALVKRNAFDLSRSLAPLLGEERANIVFGIGILGMGFSTIIILMLINGYVFCEIANRPLGGGTHLLGCLVAGVAGAAWPFVWDGDSKIWLAILASSFGMMLLPIAYVTFFMMMNSSRILGKQKPQGVKLAVWNVLMAISVLGAVAAACTAILDKINDKSHPAPGRVVLGVVIVYGILVVIGFFLRPRDAKD